MYHHQLRNVGTDYSIIPENLKSTTIFFPFGNVLKHFFHLSSSLRSHNEMENDPKQKCMIKTVRGGFRRPVAPQIVEWSFLTINRLDNVAIIVLLTHKFIYCGRREISICLHSGVWAPYICVYLKHIYRFLLCCNYNLKYYLWRLLSMCVVFFLVSKYGFSWCCCCCLVFVQDRFSLVI